MTPLTGTHFQFVPLGSPQKDFMDIFHHWQALSFCPQCPNQKWSKLFAPEKIEAT